MRPTILFHSLEHARAALAVASDLGRPIILRSAPGAAAYAGAGYLKAIVDEAAAAYPAADVAAQIDCGEDPGTALGALRAGWPAVVFSGDVELHAKLADIAAQCGAEALSGGADGPLLDLLDRADPEAACRDFLAA